MSGLHLIFFCIPRESSCKCEHPNVWAQHVIWHFPGAFGAGSPDSPLPPETTPSRAAHREIPPSTTQDRNDIYIPLSPFQSSQKTVIMVLLNLLTLGLWSKVGRLTHYAFDAVLFSAFLAGMKRSTGLTFKTDRVAGENKDFTGWIDRYLGVGEWVMDQSVAIAGSSGYFERTR
nr:unnamed protein product [Fusarium acuminatum CS5907]